ncbi:MAG: Hsp20/alpha crystallin family protein [Candidatus Methylomirabilales bacterium]
MAMRRLDPFRDLLAIQNQVSRLFGQTFGQRLGEGEVAGSWVPALDVFENEDAFTIVAELPGMTTDGVEITLHDDVLTLRGERKFYEGTPDEAFHRIERRFGPFQRRIVLPEHCDTDRVQASMNEGLLTIHVPRAERATPKRIKVTARG